MNRQFKLLWSAWAALATAFVVYVASHSRHTASESSPRPVFGATYIPGASVEISKYCPQCSAGTTDISAYFTSINAELAATHGGSSTLHFPQGTYLVANTGSISGSVALDPGAQLSVASGKTLTITGHITASPSQYVFSGAGTVSLTEPEIYTRWWGAGIISDLGVAYNRTDAALGTNSGTIVENSGGGNIATYAVVNNNHHVKLGPGQYTATTNGESGSDSAIPCELLGSPWIMHSNTSIEGAGETTVLYESSGNAPDFGSGENVFNVICGDPDPDANSVGLQSSENVSVHDLQIHGISAAVYGEAAAAIEFGNINHLDVHNVHIINGSDPGAAERCAGSGVRDHGHDEQHPNRRRMHILYGHGAANVAAVCMHVLRRAPQ